MAIIRRSIGLKTALATSGALLFVTLLFLLIFFALDIRLLTKFTLIQLILIFVGLLVFVEVILVMLASNIFVERPLQKLTEVIQKAEEGNMEVRSEIQSADEVGEISTRFNRMLTRLNNLNRHRIETEKALIQAEEGLKYKTALEEKATLIDRTNLKLETSLKDLSILYQISQLLSHTLEMSELFLNINKVLMETLDVKNFSLLIRDEGGSLEVKMVNGFDDGSKLLNMSLEGTGGLMGEALDGKKIVVVDDAEKESLFLHFQGEKNLKGSILSIPLLVADAGVGVLNLVHPREKAFGPNDIQFYQSLANHIAIAYDRSKFYMKTKELSVRDDLTGLYNRRHFHEVLTMEWKRVLRFRRALALILIDVDHFKQFNDSFGHLRGDEVLKEVAGLVQSNVREIDTLARFGGEEFVLILTDTGFKDAMAVAEKLRRHIEEQSRRWIRPGGGSFLLTVSIGVSAYPDFVQSEEDLANTADIALYRAKELGRNRVIGYDAILADSSRSSLNA